MRDLDNVFAYLYCDDGKSITFGEWENDWHPNFGPMLKFSYKVKTSWCEAIGPVEDPINGMKRFCDDLQALTSRIRSSISFQVAYGNCGLDFSINGLGNFLVKGEFGPSLNHNGELTEEFQTHEAAIVNFRQGIEAVLAEIRT